MVNNNILLSKIVANPADNAYAQAYSTLNLYIVLSLKEESSRIKEQGKEILEKLQREYFALDEKSLESIKKAVENAIDGLDKKTEASIILATIVDDVMYIVIAHEGRVLIKRHDKIGIIAEGETGSVTAFSGNLEKDDIVILETPSFAKKLSLNNASDLLKGPELNEISETLAGIIHQEPDGTEAAVILHYKTLDDSPNETKEKDQENEESPVEQESSEEPKQKFSLSLPSLPFPTKLPSKKLLLIPLILIVGLVFAGGLLMDKEHKKTMLRQKELESILTPAQKKYDEAVALESLNKGLALDSLTQAKDELSQNQNKFPEGTAERKKVDDLLSKVNSKLDQFGGSSGAKNQKTIDLSDIKSPWSITAKSGILAVVDHDTGTIAELSSDGAVSTKYKTDAKNPSALAEDKTTYYVLSENGVYSVDKKSKSSKKIISLTSASDYRGIDTFLTNIYLLNKSTPDIEKYVASSYEKSSYLKDGKLGTTPVSFTIDSSIYVTFEDGSIKKYTKGKEDSFSVKALPKPFGKALFIFTDPDITNLYVLDVNNLRLVILNKNGEFQFQIETSAIKNASSFTVVESAKRAFIISNNKLTSFEF